MDQPPPAPPALPPARPTAARWGERVIEMLLRLAALFSVAITVGIVLILVVESVRFFTHAADAKHNGDVGALFVEFFTSTEWAPMYEDNAQFGILPLICGTLVTTTVALLVALPVGSIVAIYLSEYAPFLLREILKP